MLHKPSSPAEHQLQGLLEAKFLLARIGVDIATLATKLGFTDQALLERAMLVMHSECAGCSYCTSTTFAEVRRRSAPLTESSKSSDRAAGTLIMARAAAATAKQALRVRDALTAHRHLNLAQGLLLQAAGLHMGISIGSAEQAVKSALSAKAAAGGRNRYKNSGKPEAKEFVKACWLQWQAEPSRYRNPTAFATDMLEKFEDLKSHDVIMQWARDWKRDMSLPAKS